MLSLLEIFKKKKKTILLKSKNFLETHKHSPTSMGRFFSRASLLTSSLFVLADRWPALEPGNFLMYFDKQRLFYLNVNVQKKSNGKSIF